MNKTCRKSIALLLVFLQLIVLLPATAMQTRAVEPDTAQPTLNPVVRGTVQFGSFNYTSANDSTGKDGADYVMPFIYTDDYFASSAVQPNVTGKEMPWTALENKSLATASMDFTMACFGSNEEVTSEDDYDTDYDKNGIAFLDACDFENIVSNNIEFDGSNPNTQDNKYNKFPTKDSIGVIVGSKDITVWTGEQNETFKLVAIGVRGAGYGAEWASNITLGTSGEHQGFREATNKVEYMLNGYMNQNGIAPDDHVKFWVCGYSRAGAVANLIAGDLSARYNVPKANVYGYTFESAAGANASVDPNGTAYPNIHNIINKMDVVPRVSAQFFGNNRYGVDYIVPNYANASETLNTAYYNRMFSTLQTIATGYFDKEGNPEEDAAVTNARPSTAGGTYPIDGTIQVHQFEIKSATNGSFGAVPYTGRWGNQPSGTDIGTKSGSYYYTKIDTYLDDLVSKLFGSRAWDYNPRNPSADITNTNFMTHRQKFATLQSGQSESYQDAMRDLVGIALGTPGAKLTELFDGIAGTLFSNLLDAAELLMSITGDPTGWFYKGYDQRPNDEYAEYTSNHMRTLLYGVLKDKYPFSEHRSETQTAINTLSPVLTRLFLYDRSGFGSQYLGTLLKYALSTILVTHIPGLDVSWQMAMDENYTSSYRTITLPGDANVTAYVFRPGIDDALPQNDPAAAAKARGAEVASIVNGVLTTSDQRFEIIPNDGGTVTLRYPGTMDLRFDITGSTDGLQVTDLQPDQKQVNIMTTYNRAANGNIVPESKDVTYEGMLTDRPGTSAQNFNARTDLAIAEGETLHVMAWHGSNSLDLPQTVENTYDAVKTYTVTFLDEDGETELAKAEYVPGEEPVYPNGTPEKESDAQYDYAFLGWLDEDGALYDDGLPEVTGAAVYTAAFDETLREYTVTWVIDETETTETKHYNEIPSRADPVKPAVGDTIYTFVGWDDGENRYGAGEALPAVTGDVTYTAVFIESQLLNVSYYAEDVQNKHGGEPFALTGGETDSSGVKQQANYPSYMGYALTSVVVESDGHSETIQAQDTNIDLAALNAALRSVTGASGSNQASVTAYYTKQTDQVYRVTVEHALADGTVLSSYTSDDYVVGDAVQIAAPDTKTKDGTTYWFSHWQVGEAQYGTQTITLRPNEAKTYTVRAVYSTEAPTSEAIAVEIQNVYAETQNGKNKIAITMGWSAPGLETIKQAGVRVSLKDPTLTSFSMGTSSNTGNTGSYTLHVNMTGKEDRPLYARAYLIYLDEAGTEHTVLSEPIQTYVWNDLNQTV